MFMQSSLQSSSHLLSTVFFRTKQPFADLQYLTKNDFVKIEFHNLKNNKRKKTIFGKCLAIKKKGINSTIKILYSLNKYTIKETYSLYNNFIKTITIYKKN
eukprot:Amastigsp_a845700_7.p2 type:complete len:101 gc:universal Amastigsp_a845700_7:871-569(-)